jgi:hypothetical protein
LPSLALPVVVVFEESADDVPFEDAPFDELDFGLDALAVAAFAFVVVVVARAVVVAAAAGAAFAVLDAGTGSFFAWPGASDPGLTAAALPWPLPGFEVAAGASTAIAHAAISAAASARARDSPTLLLLCVDWCASMTS